MLFIGTRFSSLYTAVDPPNNCNKQHILLPAAGVNPALGQLDSEDDDDVFCRNKKEEPSSIS